jgi:hypothetical protein
MKVYYERVLRHWHPQEAWLFVTCCLFGSLPVWKRPEQATPGEAFRNMDRLLDMDNTGPVWLKDPRVATMVEDVLRLAQHERGLCEIGGFVVMSNHVHLLMKPIAPALGNVCNGSKGYPRGERTKSCIERSSLSGKRNLMIIGFGVPTSTGGY